MGNDGWKVCYLHCKRLRLIHHNQIEKSINLDLNLNGQDFNLNCNFRWHDETFIWSILFYSSRPQPPRIYTCIDISSHSTLQIENLYHKILHLEIGTYRVYVPSPFIRYPASVLMRNQALGKVSESHLLAHFIRVLFCFNRKIQTLVLNLKGKNATAHIRCMIVIWCE